MLTPPIVDVARKILKEITSLREGIESILQKIEADNEAKNTQKDFSALPPINLHAELNEPKDIRADKKTHENRQYRLQWCLTVGTWLAFLAAAYYASTAHSQLSTMNNTYAQVQQQTDLLRKQLIGTQAATVDFRFDGYFQPGTPSGLRSVIWSTGTVIATNVHIEGNASWVTFPRLQTISTQPFRFDIPQLGRGGQFSGVNVIPLKGFTLEAWQRIQLQTTDKTIQVKGSFSYNNGFDPVPAQQFCQVWYAHPAVMGTGDQEWVGCTELKAKMSFFDYLEKKATTTQKH